MVAPEYAQRAGVQPVGSSSPHCPLPLLLASLFLFGSPQPKAPKAQSGVQEAPPFLNQRKEKVLCTEAARGGSLGDAVFL